MNDFNSKYRILEKIGEGSFSDVLKCEHKDSSVKFAAKRLKKLFPNIDEVMDCAEIIAMQKLSRHPNVLYMFEYCYNKSSKQVTFIFELMDISMFELMNQRKRSFPETKVRTYLYQLLKGLDHLHKNGLFHRDIKPENILLRLATNNYSSNSTDDVVKLADLGSIRGIYSRRPYTEYVSTRWYRSPECLLTNGYYGPKMDVWSAGCVYYEMITTKPLFPGSDELDQLDKIHTVLGTPSCHILVKFNKHKSGNYAHFAPKTGVGLDSLGLPLSKEGQIVLKLMIKYDPTIRSNVKRILELQYFRTLREKDLENKYNLSYSEYFEKNRGDCKASPMYQTKPPITRNEIKRVAKSASKCSRQETGCNKNLDIECLRCKSLGTNTKTITSTKSNQNNAKAPKALDCWGIQGDVRIRANVISKRKLSRESNSCRKQNKGNDTHKTQEDKIKSSFNGPQSTTKPSMSANKRKTRSPLLLPRQILGMSNSVTIDDYELNAITLNSCKIKNPLRNK